MDVELAAWIGTVFILPLVLGFLFPSHGRRVPLVGLAFALAFWGFFVFGNATDTPQGDWGSSRGELMYFGAIYVGACLLVWLALAWVGRKIRVRSRKPRY